jgi:hypothetical protein
VRLDRKYGDYQYRKVWREGIELAIKIKGSQENPRREWVKPEHPFTAISSEAFFLYLINSPVLSLDF